MVNCRTAVMIGGGVALLRLLLLLPMVAAALVLQGSNDSHSINVPWTVAPFTTNQTSGYRVWLDTAFFTPGEMQIIKDLIFASDGRIVLVGELNQRMAGDKGFHRPTTWDLYWTVRTPCRNALPYVQPWQRVNCIPGSEALISKREMVLTLTGAYGEAAYQIIPRSYALPEQYWVWRNWCQHNSRSNTTKWVMKKQLHRGQGIRVVDQPDAFNLGLNAFRSMNSWKVAQSFLSSQYAVEQRTMYIRLWAAVSGASPMRPYLWEGGLVIFGGEKHTNGSVQQVVNLWQERKTAVPWTMAMLKEHLTKETGSPVAADTLWQRMVDGTTLTFLANANRFRSQAMKDRAPQRGVFEVYGLDYLVDAELNPWLVEVNAYPSTARRNLGGAANCTGTDEVCRESAVSMDSEKVRWLADTLRMLGSSLPPIAIDEHGVASISPSSVRPPHVGEGPQPLAGLLAQLLADYAATCNGTCTEAALPSTGGSAAAVVQPFACWNISMAPVDVPLSLESLRGSKLCISCLTVSDIQVLADTEVEMAQRGRYKPLLGMLGTYEARMRPPAETLQAGLARVRVDPRNKSSVDAAMAVWDTVIQTAQLTEGSRQHILSSFTTEDFVRHSETPVALGRGQLLLELWHRASLSEPCPGALGEEAAKCIAARLRQTVTADCNPPEPPPAATI